MTSRRARLTVLPTRLRDGPVGRILWGVTFGLTALVSLVYLSGFYLAPPQGNLFLDSHIYFRATEAWLGGGNPWLTSYRGISFAGIPPTLLLNVPLIPFGETFATVFWVASNTASIALLVRLLKLPLRTFLMLPVVEGWLGASPDLTLAALAIGGGAWVAVLTKPYSAPSVLGERRWRPLIVAGAIGLATIPMLPWSTFWESREAIAQTFADVAVTPQSAAGNPGLSLLVVIALASLGWRRGWSLATPGLVAQLPHYMVFSLDVLARSRMLTLAAMIPIEHIMAVAVVTHAVVGRVGHWRRPRRHQGRRLRWRLSRSTAKGRARALERGCRG